MKNNRTHSNKQLLKVFAPYFAKYKSILFLDLLAASATTICELIFPLIMRKITNTAMYDINNLTFKLISTSAIIYLFLRLLDAFASYYMAHTGHIMGAKIETDMRRDAFSHLQNLSTSFYTKTKVGKIMTRITNDLFDVTEFAHHCPEEYFIGAIKLIFSFVILVNINILLTIILFTLIPIMIFLQAKFQKKMRTAFKMQREHIGELNANIEDSLLGINVVKSFANEEIEKEKFEIGNSRFLEIKKYTYKYMAGYATVSRVFAGIMYLVVILLGGYLTIKQIISPGDLVAYTLYVSTLLATINRIVQFTEQFQKGMTGIERFAEIMSADIEIFDEEDAYDLIDVKGDIEFKNVSFTYSDDKKKVLKDLSLNIKSGQNIALVGPSGGGKTTICNLIPRFYDIDSGEILIDNKNIKNITLKSLRKNIGVVQQNVYLFSGSVKENIAYGDLNAKDEDIIKAAKLAGAYDFIMNLPDKFNSYVGERGIMLSGGQKQRISIARVFLKNPKILILDEATSALDNTTEKIIQNSLEELSKGRTTITIAHRLSTIKNADIIYLLDNQKIIEKGSHNKLMENRSFYYKLYKEGEDLN